VSSSIEWGIFAVTVCARHQGKRLASRAGINDGVTYDNERIDKASTFALWATADRRDKVPTFANTATVGWRDKVFPEPCLPTVARRAKEGTLKPQFTGKRVSVETPMKTLGKTTQETTQQKKKPRRLFATRTKEGIPGCR
jgi:hypothetical protein